MIDIQSFNESLKMRWIQGYVNNNDNQGKWKLFVDYYLQKHGGKAVFLNNLKPQDVLQLKLKDPFLREIIEYWTNLYYREKNLDFNSMTLWHNSLITIQNRPFFYKAWFKAGVKEVKDLLNKDQTFLSYNAFIDKYNIKTDYLEYFKVISEVNQFKKLCSPVLHNSLSNDIAILLSRSNICKEFCRRLVQKKGFHTIAERRKMAF